MAQVIGVQDAGSGDWGGNATPPALNPIVYISSHDRAPTVDDDETLYYGIGSLWLDVSDLANPMAYLCFDATDGAAVWQEINVGSASITDGENLRAESTAMAVFVNALANKLRFRQLDSSDGSVSILGRVIPPGPGGTPAASECIDLKVDPAELDLADLGGKSYNDLDDKPTNMPTADLAADLDIAALTAEASPATGMKLVVDDAGTRKKVDWNQLPGAASGEANTASNVGPGGVGLYAGKVGVDLQFYGLYAGTGMKIELLLGGVVGIEAKTTEALWNALKLQGVEIDSGAPSDGQALVYSSGTGKWAPASVTPARQVALFAEDRKSAGGTFTAGSWAKRTLAEVSNSISGCSVTSSVVALPAGTYLIRGRAPAYRVDQHSIRLSVYDSDGGGSTTYALGSAAYARNSSYASMTDSSLEAVITLVAAGTVTLQHYCKTTRTSDGLGIWTQLDSNPNDFQRFAELFIEKLS